LSNALPAPTGSLQTVPIISFCLLGRSLWPLLTVQAWQVSYPPTQLGSSPLKTLMLLPISCELISPQLSTRCQLWSAQPLSMHQLAMFLEAHAALCLVAAESPWLALLLQRVQAPCLAHSTGSPFLQMAPNRSHEVKQRKGRTSQILRLGVQAGTEPSDFSLLTDFPLSFVAQVREMMGE